MSSDSIPFEVRAETTADQTAIWHVNRRAFGRREEADLVDALRDGGDLFASSVVVDGGDVVGHAALSIGMIESNRILVLAPVAVLPDWQSEGIGAAVVQHVMSTIGDLPVCVVGEPGYYSRFGFEAAEPFGVTAPFPVEPGALQLYRPEIVPAGAISYPTPFLNL